MNISKKNDKIIKTILVITAIIVVIGMSYALFFKNLTGTKKYVITTNNLKVYLDESKNLSDIIGDFAVPVPDYQGLQNDSYNFKIVNDEVTPMDYCIYLVMNEDNSVPTYGIRYNLANEELDLNKIANIDDESDSIGKLLYTGNIYANSKQDFDLKLWLGKNAGNDYKDGKFSAHILVTAVQNVSSIYVDNVLNGTDPIIGEGMVPVKISDTGVVTKANLYEPWYDYSNSVWANAVILNDSYGPYKDGDTIPEEAIESYFVWIPRYKYKIFDEGNYTSLTSKENAEQEIEIMFENKDIEPSTGSTLGTWLTHPAFTSFDSNGMWVGKFESGYRGATSTSGAQQDISDSTKLIIKPNVYSWRGIKVGNAFKTSYEYNRQMDSHMMKNTEWGAVAYLSQSKYGVKDLSGNAGGNIRLNNNEFYVTGYSATEEPTLGYNTSISRDGNRIDKVSPGLDGNYSINYFNASSVISSTTKNYSGIYDMSGGSWEYVMAYSTSGYPVGGNSGINSIYNNFFTDSVWSKYYDKYKASSATSFNDRILGDATGEMGPFFNQNDPDGVGRPRGSWYDDSVGYFVSSTFPWMYRGSSVSGGITAGIFAFSAYSDGTAGGDLTFRVVLTP